PRGRDARRRARARAPAPGLDRAGEAIGAHRARRRRRPPAARSGRRRAGEGRCSMARLKSLAELVQLEHTVFGLPFAGCALAFAARHGRVELWRIALAVACFGLARASAMAWNRYVDRDLDAANPRTAERPVPRGAVSPRAALRVAVTTGVLF